MNDAKPRILVIEDDAVLGGALSQRLALEGFEPVWAQDCAQALAELRRRRPDFVLSDLVLPDGSGEDVFRRALPWLGDTPIVFTTAYGEIDQAVRLVKAGADDYLSKPYDVDALIQRIRGRLARRTPGQVATAVPGDEAGGLGAAPAMAVVAEQLRRAAPSQLPVLLLGETGVGKEVAARYLHAHSPRAAAPFVAVNCGAIPPDLLESQFFGHERGAFTGASQRHVGYLDEVGAGTLFLDEVGELDPRLQTALLRVLQDGHFRPVGARQERRFNGRVVAATNAELAQMRAERRFRDDLYFRLSVVELQLPPLRERHADIAPLARQFLRELAQAGGRAGLSLSAPAVQALQQHHWPGNVRELRNRVQRAGVMAAGLQLEAADLFPESRLDDPGTATLAQARQRAEADLIEQALHNSGGRVGEAARQLGISRTTLWKRRSQGKG